MSLANKEYPFPDAFLLNENLKDDTCIIWRPEFRCIVLGDNSPDNLCIYNKRIIQDKIPVYRRSSGGETVFLSPNIIVISAVKFQFNPQTLKNSYALYNKRIIKVLSSFGIKNIIEKGFSDITIDDQKIMRSTIYQDKERLFFYAVLNVNESGSMIEHYIKHPKNEIDCENGKKSGPYISSLAEKGYDLPIKQILATLIKEFMKNEKQR